MIRKAVPRDLEAVLRLERAAFSAPHWPWEAYEQMLAEGGAIQRVLLVAETAAEEILGFAGGSLVLGEAQLESIAVAAAVQRQGVGRQLCRAFLDWARAGRAGSVALEVRASSEGAQRLYSGLGFRAAGRRPRYYQNPVEDGILMLCVLEENSR